MVYEEKTLENIVNDMKAAIGGDMSTEEGTLIDHALRGAAAELEQAYIELGTVEQNGYAQTADREHLILRAKERGIEPFAASTAVWRAEFNIEIEPDARFSAGELTYLCTGKIREREYRLTCEQTGAKGNTKQDDLLPIEYMDGYERGELVELLTPGRDEEETEAFRARYISIVAAAQAFWGNRAQYKALMHEIKGVGACKIYRVTKDDRRIKIYLLDSTYRTPSNELVADVQETIDPIGKQGEGEGEAAIFQIVDIFPCASVTVDIEAKITVDTGYTWESLLPEIQEKINNYYMELAKGWENENYITVRILRVNAAIASVEGVVDVQDTMLNGRDENLLLDVNAVPVRGVIVCRQ